MTGRDILLLADHRDSVPEARTFELINRACALATDAGGRARGLVLCGPGAGVEKHLDAAGLDDLQLVEDERLSEYSPEAFGKVAADAVRRLQPALFLCAHGLAGMEVAPFVAASLAAPLIPNCATLEVDGDALVAERLVHGQAWQTRLRLAWSRTIVASMARGGGSGARREERAGRTRVQRLDVDLEALRIRTVVTGSIRPGPGEVDISRAEVVVGAGRGIRDASNLRLVEELAEALGGVVACSRPLVDLGWLPYERQVGASGQAIRPRVYVACGISGAAQHLAGIAEAGTVIAINSDARAPIFRVAHVGVVGDLLQVVPELTFEARRRRD